MGDVAAVLGNVGCGAEKHSDHWKSGGYIFPWTASIAARSNQGTWCRTGVASSSVYCLKSN